VNPEPCVLKLAPALCHQYDKEGKMFRKLGILGFLFTVFTMLAPIQAAAYYHPRGHYYHHPRGYYFHRGHWVPYRGYGYPYRAGYYDRLGRWHGYH
jgi:hypothetical protein